MTSDARDILRQLVRAEILAAKNMFAENKRSLLITTPFWIAGISLVSAGIFYGFGRAATLMIETLDAPQAHEAAAAISYFVLIALSILMFVLAAEKTWPEMLDARHFESFSSKRGDLSDTEVRAIVGFRFVRTTLLSVSSFLCLALFGAAPLAALGLAMGAPAFYYPLLLLALLLFSVTPSSLGLMAAASLSKIFSPGRIAPAFGIISFFAIFFSLVVFVIGIVPVLPQATTPIAAAMHWLAYVVPLSVTVTSVNHALLGDAPRSIAFLVGTLLVTLMSSGVGLMLAQRMASRSLNGAEGPRGVAASIGSTAAKVSASLYSSRYGSIIRKEWGDLYVLKTPERRAEIARPFVVLIAVYALVAYVLAPEDPASIKVAVLIHLAVIGLLSYTALFAIRSLSGDERPLDEISHLKGIDDADIEALLEADRDFALAESTRFYKASALSGSEIAWCRWLIYFLPMAAGAGLLLLVMNVLIGTPAITVVASIMALLLLIAPYVALSLLLDAELAANKEVGRWAALRHHLYYVVALVILVPGFTDRFDLLDHPYALPPQVLAITLDIAFVATAVIVLMLALGKAGREWEKVKT